MDEERLFVAEVRWIVQQIKDGTPKSELLGSEDGVRVAAGYSFLFDLLMKYFETADRYGWGCSEASGVLDAMFSGSSHPVWRYLEMVRKDARPRPATAETGRRTAVIGFTQALRTNRQMRTMPWTAVRELLNQAGIGITADQMKGWNARLTRDEQRFADQFERTILDFSERFGEQIEKIGVDQVRVAWDP